MNTYGRPLRSTPVNKRCGGRHDNVKGSEGRGPLPRGHVAVLPHKGIQHIIVVVLKWIVDNDVKKQSIKRYKITHFVVSRNQEG
jgi:hypothetical protein